MSVTLRNAVSGRDCNEAAVTVGKTKLPGLENRRNAGCPRSDRSLTLAAPAL